jgi:hypothetical protein
VDMNETGCRRRKVAQWSNCVAGYVERWQDWQARAQVRQSFRMPDHTKRCAISFTFALVLGATDHGRTGTLGAVGELERTAEISRQTHHSRWRL